MKEIFIFLAGAFASKMIKDNLPDLNLRRGFKKYISPLLLPLCILLLPIAIKLTKNSEAKKNLQHTLILLTSVYLITELISSKNNKQLIK